MTQKDIIATEDELKKNYYSKSKQERRDIENKIKDAKDLLELLINNQRQINALEEEIKETRYVENEDVSREELTITRSIDNLKVLLKFL